MNTRLSRRELAGAVLGAAAAARPAAAQQIAARDEAALAQKSVRESSEVLAKFDIAITLEPSFTFRP